MDVKERLEAVFAGEKPDRIPYSLYHFEAEKLYGAPAFEKLLRAGLGVTYHLDAVQHHCPVLEYREEHVQEKGKDICRIRMITPKGELFSIYEDGWARKFYLETKEDYALMTYIVKNTVPISHEAYYMKRLSEFGPEVIPLVMVGRTPMQVINVDYVGLENFALHLYDYLDELQELYDAMLVNYRKTVEIAASMPARYACLLENFTAESLGPKRYEEYLLPVYQEVVPVLQQSGKIVGVHYDGRLASCKHLIARAPFHALESLTEPPEGDMRIGACRAAFEDKIFWCNLNVSAYSLPEEQLRERVDDLVREGSADGRLFALEVSEQLPTNWRDSMPIVLDELSRLTL